MYTCLAVLGLLIDVAGASILSIPDLPRVRNWFKFGKIKQGRKKVMSGGLKPGDTGHSEIVDIYDELKNDYGFTDASIKEIKVESISEPVFEDAEVVDRRPRRSLEIDIDPEEIDGESRITTARDTKFRLLDRIDSDIETGEQSLRRKGIGLIVFGFSLQIPQYII